MKTVLTALLVGALLTSGCGSNGSRGGSAELESITSVSQFQRAFDAERGTARLVILLSPT